MDKSCCECEYALLWYDEELFCLIKGKIVDGNDPACAGFKAD